MIKIAVVGPVDAGKTTLVNLFSKKRFEKYGRTESLSFIKGLIQNQQVNFIDCPGHNALGYSKSMGLCLADVVLYVVDVHNVDLSWLSQIDRPTLVLMNRWTANVPLKELCRSDKERNLLYSKLDLLSKGECTPFLDSNEDGFFLFPINLKTGWGVKEFETYFSKLWLPKFKIKDRLLLYLVENKPQFKYKLLGDEPPPKMIYLDNEAHLFSKVFTFNKVEKTYTLKDDFLRYNSLILDLLNSKDCRINPPQKHFFEYSEQFTKLLQRVNRYPLSYLIYGDKPYKVQALKNVFKGMKVEILDNLSYANFLKVDLDETVKIGWVEEQNLDFQKNLICSDSYYALLDHLKSYFLKYITEQIDKVKCELKKIFIGTCQLNYVFKNSKKELVCGVKIVQGQLFKGSHVLFKNASKEIAATILDLQIQGKSKSRWGDPDKEVAVKFELKEPWDPLSSPSSFFQSESLNLLQIYSKETEEQITQLISQIRKNLSIYCSLKP